MRKKAFLAVLTTALISGCASPAQTGTTTAAAETKPSAESASEETEEAAAKQTDEKTPEELTGKAQGFGGTITATVTTVDGVITQVVLDGPDETPGIGGAALEELAARFTDAKSTGIDGVAGATVTSSGAVAAVLNALDPEANPYEEPQNTDQVADMEPVTFPDGKKIVSATTYGIYTKSPASLQDAVIKATLYWNQTDSQVWDIRFLQAMLPWDDNGALGGWANITDEDVIKELGDALISFEGNEHGAQVPCNYAKYLQIGDIVWTGELGSDPAADQAVVYQAEINGKKVRLNDYVSDEEGGAWYHEAALNDACILKSPQVSAPDSDNVAVSFPITYKETNGHGENYWTSDIKFSGNMQAIKDFVTENGFDYGYYKDGQITQNNDGCWQSADAVSGATLDETPTYLDMLKLLYERIESGEYKEEN